MIILMHIIGAIITMIVHYKDGVFECAAKYGDGIRFAKPSDVIAQDLILWEIDFLLFILFSIETFINNAFDNKYKSAD